MRTAEVLAFASENGVKPKQKRLDRSYGKLAAADAAIMRRANRIKP
jgi:hypothetical protein